MPTLKADGTRLNGKGSSWITPKRRKAIYIRDGWRCRYCARWLKNVPARMRTLDHKVPVCKGGTHASGNLVTCCKRCNDRKQHKMYDAFKRMIAER